MTEHNELKEQYRPQGDAVDQQVEGELGDIDLNDLYGFQGQASRQEQTPRLVGTVKGWVSRIDPKNDAIFVDLGGKNVGIAPYRQWEDEEPALGFEYQWQVIRFDPEEDLYKLNKPGAASKEVGWEHIERGQVVEAMVTGMNKGGLEVKVGQLRGFLPAGQFDVQFHKDLSVFIGEKVQAKVTKVDARAKNLTLSRRAVLEAEAAEKKEELFKTLEEGAVLRGKVRKVMEFGAFVDLGGADGLLHVSEMTYNRHVKSSDMVKEGDQVDVKVIKFDTQTGKISLSLKQLMRDPWADAGDKYAVGSMITARVVKLENFGAFLEVEEGMEGLLPISEMSWQRIRHPSEAAGVNDTIRVVVIGLDTAAKKLTFSLKQAGGDPFKEAEARYARGTVADGTVTRVADFGAFVELEAGLEGLVHISELDHKRVNKPGDVVRPGQQVKVRVLELDSEKRRIALSIKQADASYAMPDPATIEQRPSKPRKTKLRGGLDF